MPFKFEQGRGKQLKPITSIKFWLKDVFLPKDYPASVRNDYFKYQVYDTLQALCSSINRQLSVRSMLKRAGVGDASASTTAATITWILKDGTSMIGHILFAYNYAFTLDADLKKWRFAADIFNDFALTMNMIAPLFPRNYSWILVCISALASSICGVCGGSTKAALSQHFAIRQNIADLNAKDGSQETLISLVGLFLGSILVKSVQEDDLLKVWTIFTFFNLLHLYFNYNAVRNVNLVSLNDQRCFLLIKHFLDDDSIKTPAEISKEESILFYSCPIVLGCPLKSLISRETTAVDCQEFYTDLIHGKQCVAIRETPDEDELLRLFFLASYLYIRKKRANPKLLADIDREFVQFREKLGEKGWSIDQYSIRISYQGWTYVLKGE